MKGIMTTMYRALETKLHKDLLYSKANDKDASVVGGVVRKFDGKDFFRAFVLGETVAQTARGTVYMATITGAREGSKEAETEYVVKRTFKIRLKESAKQAILEEVRILHALEHPNIVKILQFYRKDPGYYYMVLESLPGGELFDRVVQKDSYNELEARDLIRILIGAVKYVHDQGVVHRDLKPDNLMLATPGEVASVKIADFGLACSVFNGPVTKQCSMGAFTAPELITGEPYGTAVDMWSVGVLVHILLSGNQPFYDGDQTRMLHKIKTGELHLDNADWRNVSDEAKDFVCRLLTVDQTKRMTAGQAFGHNWLLATGETLATHNLAKNLEHLQVYNAKRKLRAAIKSVLAARALIGKIGPPTSATKAVTGQFADAYVLGKELGAGAFATVYKATAAAGGASAAQTCYAVKRTTRQGLSKEDETSVFDEVRILQDLNHPNVVGIHEFYEVPEYYYVVLEFVAGGELLDRIVQKAVYNEEEARELCRVLLGAVKYCHDRGVVHRDLKPENLLLASETDDASIKIADFGFACSVGDGDLTEGCGTPGYVAPEILRSMPYNTTPDMWSVGVIIYIILGGYPPFHDENQTRLFRRIKSGNFKFHEEYWSGISEDAKDLIRKLLVVDPALRLTAKEAVQHPWLKHRRESLAANDLRKNLQQLRIFNATRKLRATIKSVLVARKIAAEIELLWGMDSIPSVSAARDGEGAGRGGIAAKGRGSPEPSGDFNSDFVMGEELGKGACATVFKATITVAATEAEGSREAGTYAVKRTTRAGLSEEDKRGVFEEVSIMRELEHPNVVGIYGFYKNDPEYYYMVMEFMAGGVLFDRITQKTFYNEEEARDLCRLLLGAVKYCHDRGVVHRDLKPENLLLASKTDDASVKLADFGFAASVLDGDLTAKCGTPGYVAPEILKGVPYKTSVDMWSIGVIIYIILGGYPPFHDENQTRLFRKIKAGNFKFHEEYWSGISEDAKDLIRKLLRVDVSKRMTASETVDHPWLVTTGKILADNNLGKNLEKLRIFNASRKLRAAIRSVVAAKKIARDLGLLTPSPLLASSENFSDAFALGAELGSGAFATVFKAIAIEGGEAASAAQVCYAVKRTTRTGLSKEDELSVFEEVRIMRNLHHPNVVGTYEFYKSDPEYYYMVMEFMAGGVLFDRITQKAFYNEEEARDLCRLLLDAVKYCHDQGVVHRDLKPENLLLASKTDDASVKLADFGFAASVLDGDLKARCGTPGYVAPEILKGVPYKTSVDMWSIGVIIYIILGGYPPFHDDNQTRLFRKIKAGNFKFHSEYWSGISDKAKDLIRNLLRVDVSKRMTASEAVQHPWLVTTGQGLADNSLGKNLEQLRIFNATRKLRAAIRSVVAAKKIAVDLGLV